MISNVAKPTNTFAAQVSSGGNHQQVLYPVILEAQTNTAAPTMIR